MPRVCEIPRFVPPHNHSHSAICGPGRAPRNGVGQKRMRLRPLLRVWCLIVGHRPWNTDYSSKRNHPGYLHTYACLRCQLARVEAENAKLRDLMFKVEEYSDHVIGCDLANGLKTNVCTCGLWELQTRVYAEELPQEKAQGEGGDAD